MYRLAQRFDILLERIQYLRQTRFIRLLERLRAFVDYRRSDFAKGEFRILADFGSLLALLPQLLLQPCVLAPQIGKIRAHGRRLATQGIAFGSRRTTLVLLRREQRLRSHGACARKQIAAYRPYDDSQYCNSEYQ